MFEQLLLDLHVILDRARSLIKEYEQRLRDVKDRESDTLKLKEKLGDQSKGLEDREAECKKVENVVKLQKDVQALQDSLHLRGNALSRAESDLKARIALENGKLTEACLLNEKAAKINENRKKTIDDEVTKRVQEVLKKAGLK